MNAQLIFIPMLCHIFLVLSLYGLLLLRKKAAARKGDVDLKATALNCKLWPDSVVKVSNNIDNQFQVPMLFHSLCLILFLSGGVSQVALILAWTFLLSRLLHAYIHCTTNYVPHRMKSFAIGVAAVFGLLLAATYQLLPGFFV